MTTVRDYSTTAGSNATVGGISVAEGCSASNLNNAIRAVMADTAVWRAALEGAKTGGGTANAQTLTTGMSIGSYAVPMMIAFKAGATNTTTTTMAVDGLSAKTVKRVDSSNLLAGDITTGGVYLLAYESSADVLFLLNPTPSVNAELTAIGALSTTGLVARTAAATYVPRTLTAPAAGITVTNGDGVSGAPTLVLANDLSALEGLASTGIAVRTTTDTWAQRTIAGTSNEVTVTNGDGVSGNPTLALPSTLALRGKAVQVQDSNFTISDDGDATKLLAFQISGVTAGNTRTVTIPDKSGTMAMTSDITAGGLTIISNSQPTSDAGTFSVTGLSSYTFVKIHGFFECSAGTGLALAFRVSAGTFRDLGTVLDISGGAPNQLISFDIEVHNVKNASEKIITTRFAAVGSTTLDSSNAVNSITQAPTLNAYFASWDEIWDEVKITATGGTIAWTTADQRGRVLVYGS